MFTKIKRENITKQKNNKQIIIKENLIYDY